MMTLFGRIAPLPGNTEKPHPVDVVKLLGRTRRFGGNADLDWSVLHHSMLCAVLWLKSYGMDGVEQVLMHDFHEAYLGDIPSPVKEAIGREHIDKVEADLDVRIFEMAGCRQDSDEKRWVKYVDMAALFIEAHYIATPGHLKHIVEGCSEMKLVMRLEILKVINDSCPEVVEELDKLGFTSGSNQ